MDQNPNGIAQSLQIQLSVNIVMLIVCQLCRQTPICFYDSGRPLLWLVSFNINATYEIWNIIYSLV